MAGEPPNDTVWWSTLEDYPEHVRAIGMISIENANLEYDDMKFPRPAIRPLVVETLMRTAMRSAGSGGFRLALLETSFRCARLTTSTYEFAARGSPAGKPRAGLDRRRT